MSQSNLLRVTLLRRFVIGTLSGGVGSFVYGILESHHIQTALMITFIGGIGFGIAEVISIIGKTWWQSSLVWGTTMGITICVLTRLLLPSVDLNIISVFAGSFTYSLSINFFEKVLLIR